MLASKEHRRITDTSCDSKLAMDTAVAVEIFLDKLFAKCLVHQQHSEGDLWHKKQNMQSYRKGSLIYSMNSPVANVSSTIHSRVI